MDPKRRSKERPKQKNRKKFRVTPSLSNSAGFSSRQQHSQTRQEVYLLRAKNHNGCRRVTQQCGYRAPVWHHASLCIQVCDANSFGPGGKFERSLYPNNKNCHEEGNRLQGITKFCKVSSIDPSLVRSSSQPNDGPARVVAKWSLAMQHRRASAKL